MDPFWHPAAVVPVVSTVTVGMVMSTAMRVMGGVVGVPSACVPRGQQHLRMMVEKVLLAEELHYSDVVNW